MVSIPKSRLKRMKKEHLVQCIRVLERRSNRLEDFIKEQIQRSKEKTLQQTHKDIERWCNATQVVMCKDCKHYEKDSLWCGMNSQDRKEWFNWYEDDYCSYGERKDNDLQRKTD